MQSEKLYFTSSDGNRLAARLDLPLEQKPSGFALFAHCFTCTKNLNPVVNINRALTLQGLAVLRFDFTGLGESEGDFSLTDFSTNVSDLVCAAQFLAKAYEPPKLLIGHSLGGAAVIQAARKIDSVRAVCTIGAPAELSGVLNFMDAASLEKLENEGEALIDIGGKILKIRRQLRDSLRLENMIEAISNLGKPLLIFHSPLDRVVSIDQAAKIFSAARHPKSFVSLDSADHLLSQKEDSLYTGQVLAAWATKYLHFSQKKFSGPKPGDNRVTAYIGKTGFRTEIIANGHKLIADEPVEGGGANSGPSPYDLLTAALGACTAMTLRLYADRKKLPLDAAVVKLSHAKIHLNDCKDCEDPGSRIDYIEREIELQGDLERSTRERMLEIADRCPVHRTLESRSKIVSRLKE
ncbi:MAG: alpha/beta fold hydrolase [Syntrophobacteraceae bacterium]